MSNLVVLQGIELIPVVELEPMKFSTQGRQSPSGSGREVPEEWQRYWRDSLADSGITSITPLRVGSWHVPTPEFSNSDMLKKFLEVTIREWDGIETLSDPDCRPVLNGGLALSCPNSDVLIPPTCCSDLGDLANWKEAAVYKKPEWAMLWIGHPWLSVRFQAPWLIISNLHESDSPTEKWGVSPDDLSQALVIAKAELDRFALRIADQLPSLGYQGDSLLMGRKFAGLVA